MKSYYRNRYLWIWLGCGILFFLAGMMKLPKIDFLNYVVGLIMLCVWRIKTKVSFITLDDQSLIVNPGMRKISYRLADIENPYIVKNSIWFTHKVNGKSKKVAISVSHLNKETVEMVLADLKQALGEV